MSKFGSITREQVYDMVTEINECITAVEAATVPHVVTAIMDSIREGAVWTDSQEDVTEEEIGIIVVEWIGDNTTTPATPTAAEVIANINANEAFGVAWGADGQVLTHAETCEAIAKGNGWFDRQGRWVNRAGWEKRHAGLGAWVAAKLAE